MYVSKFKASLKGKPRLWFEMQYPTPGDEPKTKEAYEKMVSSFITEHNPIGSTREQQIMAWRSLKWDPAQERLDDFVYKLKRIGQELGKNADEQLEYFKYSVPPHLYLYLQGTTTIKEAMENIKSLYLRWSFSTNCPSRYNNYTISSFHANDRETRF